MDDSLEANLEELKRRMHASPDLIVRRFELGSDHRVEIAVAYIENLVADEKVNKFVMDALLRNSEAHRTITLDTAFDWIKENALASGEAKVSTGWDSLLMGLLSGNTVVFVEGWNETVLAHTAHLVNRSVEEAGTEVAIRGPRDSFIEAIQTNISLIRRRIKSPDLRLETLRLGKVSRTEVAIMYIQGIANTKMVAEVRKRIKRIEIDGMLEGGMIEEFIEDKTFTLFPTIYYSERPDTISANLLEGRVAVIVDGTPFVLIAPTTFAQFFHSADDYYQRFDIATFLRFLRVATYGIATLGPSIYIALTTFHHEMVPIALLLSLAAQREGVPFPAVVEAMIMEIIFEFLREAGVRMPRIVGGAVTVVGAVVLGQAVVEAGLVSQAMVIVVSLTAVSSFAVPATHIQPSSRLLRFLFMISAATLGFFGMMVVMIGVLAHMCSLRSFGVPYLKPFAPFILSDHKDTLFRFPIWAHRKRPLWTSEKPERIEKGQSPTPPSSDGES
ncbi:spore germination protein [Salinithrix halophila]|uniref:Spore germination protein n=1 Tax=Salinithrix halophila TaxID=1485204 RepID=A0ABV8JE04_9BACL